MKLWMLACLLCFCTFARASQLHVPSEYSSIQQALDATSEGDTVLVARGTYVELLATPSWGVTLASHYMFTQDTTDIQETILDGDYQGTVLEVFTQTPAVLHLQGFTVQNGEGYFNNSWDMRAGAIQLHPDVSINFQDLVFRYNRGYDRAAPILDQEGSISREGNFSFQRIHIHDNVLLDAEGMEECMRIYMYGLGIVEDLVIAQNNGQNVCNFLADAGIQVSRVTMVDGTDTGHHLVIFKSEGLTSARDITIRNCHNEDSGVLGLEGDTLIVRNVHITDNLNDGAGRGNRNTFNSSILDMDSLYIQRNRVLFQGDGAGTINGDGTIRNLHVTDNIVGDSLQPVARGHILSIGYADVLDSEFSRNTVLNGPVDGEQAMWGGSVVAYSSHLDTSRFINCRFEDNYLHDPDDYTQFQNPWPNKGRALYHACYGEYAELRDCVFRNNRQPNHAPEWPGMDLWHRSVGSTVEFVGGGLVHYQLDNVLMEDCDDGGIALRDGFDSIFMNQVVIRRTNRFGLSIVGPDTLSLQNCVFEEIAEQDNHLPYPYDDSYQAALIAGLDNGVSSLDNVTLVNCTMSKLFTGGFDFHNSILWGNEYTTLADPDWDLPSFQNSVLQVGMEGEDCLVEDPLFDVDLGIPYLSPASPAIDAGNPDPVYNDVEDPESPGFALWPSQGGLRNDMGYTGGPGAREQDPQVSVTPKETPALPASIALHPAWPNPFNPATTVAFDLPNSAPVTLAVYNLRGQKVHTLVHDLLPAGRHEVVFQAEGLASGVYFLRLAALGEVRTGKVLLLK